MKIEQYRHKSSANELISAVSSTRAAYYTILHAIAILPYTPQCNLYPTPDPPRPCVMEDAAASEYDKKDAALDKLMNRGHTKRRNRKDKTRLGLYEHGHGMEIIRGSLAEAGKIIKMGHNDTMGENAHCGTKSAPGRGRESGRWWKEGKKHFKVRHRTTCIYREQRRAYDAITPHVGKVDHLVEIVKGLSSSICLAGFFTGPEERSAKFWVKITKVCFSNNSRAGHLPFIMKILLKFFARFLDVPYFLNPVFLFFLVPLSMETGATFGSIAVSVTFDANVGCSSICERKYRNKSVEYGQFYVNPSQPLLSLLWHLDFASSSSRFSPRLDPLLVPGGRSVTAGGALFSMYSILFAPAAAPVGPGVPAAPAWGQIAGPSLSCWSISMNVIPYTSGLDCFF
ncbi:hypothetical protein B0H13DRAFT_1854755 [Mycena leptocephala]|nr:hypothetical protein B0H13DRAFT_1854755 [Mycena leptocephala]